MIFNLKSVLELFTFDYEYILTKKNITQEELNELIVMIKD